MQPSGNRFGVNIEQASTRPGEYGRSISPTFIEDVIAASKPVLQEDTGNFIHTSGSVKVILNRHGAVVSVITYYDETRWV